MKYIKKFESFKKINEEGTFNNTIYGISLALLSLMQPSKVLASQQNNTTNANMDKVENLENVKSDLQKLRDLSKSEEEKSLLTKIINLQEDILRDKFNKVEYDILLNDLSSYLMEKELYNSDFKDTLKNIKDGNIRNLRSDYIKLYNIANNSAEDNQSGVVYGGTGGPTGGSDGLFGILSLLCIIVIIFAFPASDGEGGFQPFGVNIFNKIQLKRKGTLDND
jgi:hypothetical protein